MSQITKLKTKPNKNSEFSPFGTLRQTERKILNAGREDMQNAARNANTFSRIATQCANICSDNMSACVESSHLASRNLQDLSHRMIEEWNKGFSQLANFSVEALRSHNVKDLTTAQNRATQHLYDNYIEEFNKLSAAFLDGCYKAMEPLHNRSITTSKQLSKLMVL